MPNLLVLDASSSLCSVALLTENGDFWKTENQPRRHAQRLLMMVDEIMTESGLNRGDLDGVAFGRGPGSFTGIRIAVSVSQGLSLGLDIPVCGLSALQTMAQSVLVEGAAGDRVMTLMDAHMGEVFWGQYELDAGIAVAVSDERVGTPEVCLQVMSDWQGSVAGAGLELAAFADCPQALNHIQPEARFMSRLARQAWDDGLFGDSSQHPPVYLRNSVVWKKLDEQPSLLNPKKD